MFTILYARYASSRPGWEIFDVEQSTVVAFIEHEEGDFTDYPIGLRSKISFLQNPISTGTNLWTFVNNSCPKSSSNMNLNSCGDDEFPCRNGECIPLASRCNILNDCSDQSDERNCNLVTMAQGYNRKIPPVTRGTEYGRDNFEMSQRSVEVVVEIQVFEISRLNEKTGTLNLGLIIDTYWYDNRLMYNFLKHDKNMNHIPTLQTTSEFIVWTPTLLFGNTNGALATSRHRVGIYMG